MLRSWINALLTNKSLVLWSIFVYLTFSFPHRLPKEEVMYDPKTYPTTREGCEVWPKNFQELEKKQLFLRTARSQTQLTLISSVLYFTPFPPTSWTIGPFPLNIVISGLGWGVVTIINHQLIFKPSHELIPVNYQYELMNCQDSFKKVK